MVEIRQEPHFLSLLAYQSNANAIASLSVTTWIYKIESSEYFENIKLVSDYRSLFPAQT